MNPEATPHQIPTPNASTVVSRKQAVTLAAAGLFLVAALWLDAHRTVLVLNVAFILFYLAFCHYRLALQFLSLRTSRQPFDPAAVPPGGWPAYTVLVPLYREETAVPGLMAHLRLLDYPVDRLQILLLVEEDDLRTREAVDRAGVTPPFEVVVVPVSLPRTKPKACNAGLRRATGDILVIFDAEDRPETDQLKKAVGLFAGAPADVVCLQAQLNYYNRDRNLLTGFFAIEYSGWFDYCLPGLYRMDAPIPLGGTSNHFLLPVLRQIGGWDPYNVTEDCDLGIRLYRNGLRTAMLDSTTWEEATFRIRPWIRQRSRWVKGYLQTYLVHLREHGALRRRLGPGRMMHFHLLFGAGCLCLLMNPFYWLLTAAWFVTGSQAVSGFFPLWVLVPALLSFLAGNAAFVLSAMLGCLRRRYYHLLPLCLLMPVYWVLMSVGAWKGALQLITKPFFWEKTPHEGTATGNETP
jgi:cellulose synthase/poly-beta-1,6-N-acetylglucosamine synthase-like glycosyltransferase